MKKYTVICRLLISFCCIIFLFASCDDSAKGPKKPTVVRKKLTGSGQPQSAVAAQRTRPAKPEPRPTVPEVKPVKAEKPPPQPPAAKPTAPPPASQPPEKIVVAKVKTPKPAGGNELPQPKSDISTLTTAPKVSAPAAKAGDSQPAESKPLLASVDGDRPLYNPAGKIDPFEPLFKDKPNPKQLKTSSRKRREPRTPLERIDISQLKLVGIIMAASGNRALVEESSGKGYVIRKGTYIGTNAGKVTEINKDMVIVEEEYEDVFGKLVIQKKEIKLPKPPGEL